MRARPTGSDQGLEECRQALGRKAASAQESEPVNRTRAKGAGMLAAADLVVSRE